MGLRFRSFAQWILWGAALNFALLGTTAFALAGGDDLKLTCAGNSYWKGDPFPTPETFFLDVAGTKPVKVMIKQLGSEKADKAGTVANNSLQLKFATSKFVGEYFYFTGDLFLITTDGHLIRLVCKPS